MADFIFTVSLGITVTQSPSPTFPHITTWNPQLRWNISAEELCLLRHLLAVKVDSGDLPFLSLIFWPSFELSSSRGFVDSKITFKTISFYKLSTTPPQTIRKTFCFLLAASWWFIIIESCRSLTRCSWNQRHPKLSSSWTIKGFTHSMVSPQECPHNCPDAFRGADSWKSHTHTNTLFGVPTLVWQTCCHHQCCHEPTIQTSAWN